MSDEKKHLYAVRVQESDKFQPMVDRYNFVKETTSYYVVMDHGNETRFHKSNVKFRYFFTIEKVQEHLKKVKELAIEKLKSKIEEIENRTRVGINEVNPEPFTLFDDIKL